MTGRICGILAGVFAYAVVVTGSEPATTNSPAQVVSNAVKKVVAAPVSRLAQADELFARGAYREAGVLYDRLTLERQSEKEVAAYTLFQSGLCRLKIEHPSEALTIWSRLRQTYPTSLYAPRSLGVEVQLAPTPFRIGVLTDEILTKYSNSVEAATILIQRGEAAASRKDYTAAAASWQRFVALFPQHPRWAEIQKKTEIVALSAKGNRAADTEGNVLNLLAQADALYDKAAYREAALLYGRIVSAFSAAPQFTEASVRLARCQFALEKPEEAVQTLQRVLDRTPPDAARLLAELVTHTAGLRPMDAVREKATALLLDRYPQSAEAQQALFVAGTVALARHEKREARERWQALLRRYPETPFRTTIEKELQLAEQPPPPPKPVVPKPKPPTAEELAVRRAQEGKQREVEVARLEVAWCNAWNTMDERADTALRLARALTALGRHEQALKVYQWIPQQTPAHPVADLAVLEAGQVCLTRRDETGATERFIFLIEHYPQSHWRPVALFWLGNRRVVVDGDLKAAWVYYHQLLAEYPQHELAELTRTYWAQLQKLKPEELRAQVEKFRHQQRRTERT